MSFSIADLKAEIKRTPALKRIALLLLRLVQAPSWHIRPGALFQYARFLRDWLDYRRAGGTASALDLYPCLYDRIASTGIDSHYFHQSIWAFGRIIRKRPPYHLDVASEVNFVGLLTTITQVIFADIRPLFISLPNYQGIGASVTALPFATSSLPSLSCLHVIEHVGLGRYGDPIDPFGPERACAEISRVLALDGNAYVSLPVGRRRVSFNGLRVFSADEVCWLFAGLELQEMGLVDTMGNYIEQCTPANANIREESGGLDFGLGLFHFVKKTQS